MKATQTVVTLSDVTIPKETADKSGILEGKKEDFKIQQLLAIASSKGTNINDSHAAFDILPDLRLTSDILVSETLSPKDLSLPKMNVVIDTDGLDIDLSSSDIVTKINKHFSENGYYDLESQLYKILEESYVTAGAVPLMLLKKTEIDDFITGRNSANSKFSMESVKGKVSQNKNLITTVQKKGGVLDVASVVITDNVNELKVALVDSFDIEIKLKELGMENAKPNVLSFVDLNRMTDNVSGHPLVFKLPVESVIPVHVPGQPDKHVGYYVLTEGGYPISHRKDSGELLKLEKRIKDILNGSDDVYKNVITVGSNDSGSKKKITPEEYMKVYSSKVRDELKQSLKSGLYRRELEVSNHDDAYSLLFHKTLEKKKVKMIYVPAGVINYVAFDYDTRGIGKSLMEKNKLFSTIRAAMLIADIFGSIKNSIPQTNIGVTIDEEDPDPYTTLEIIKDKISKMTGASLPIGTLQPSDIMDALQKASINMTVEGGNAFPNTRAEVVDGSRQVVKSDTDLNDMLKKMNISGMNMSPEKVDRALEGDYATSTLTTNAMDARRVMMRQKIFEKHISEFLRNYIRISGPLRKLFEDIDKNKANKLIDRVQFKLPAADVSKLTSNLEDYEKASDLIDAMVEDQVNENMLRDILQGSYTPNALDNVRELMASYYKIEFARENNIMPEIVKLSSGENEYIVEAVANRTSNIVALASELINVSLKAEGKGDKKINKTVEKLGGGEDETPPPTKTPNPDDNEPDIFDEPTPEPDPEDDGLGENKTTEEDQ